MNESHKSIYTYTYTHIHTYIYTYTYTHIHIHTSGVHIHIYVYTYIYTATALHSAAPRRNRWGPTIPVAGSASASALQNAPPTAAASVATLHAWAQHLGIPPMGVGGAYLGALPPMGGGGRPQQGCERVGCHNHKVLNCSYGFCMPCCANEKRTPRCQVTRHHSKNKHQ